MSLVALALVALTSASVSAAPDDRAFRNWGPPFEEGFRARAVFWDQTNAILETPERKYVFTPIEKLATQDKAYFASLPLPPIARDRLRWGVTELAKEIPLMPVNGFSGRVIAFNGRQFLVAVRNDRIADTLHPPSMLDEASLRQLMDLYADELAPEERILAAASTHEAVWTADPETASNVLPKATFDDVLPAGALPIAYDGFWLAYKDPPSADGPPGALRTLRVSEADAKAAKLRDFLLEKFVDEARYVPDDAGPSLIRALGRKERLTSAPVGEKRRFEGASSRSGSPVEGRWIYRDETGSVILLADNTIEVVAGTEADAEWYESIGAGTMAGTTVYEDLSEPYPWREWSSLPEGEREARFVFRSESSAFVQFRNGDYLRFDRKSLDAEDEEYVASAELGPHDAPFVRMSPLPSAYVWGNQPVEMMEARPIAFNGRAAVCAAPEGRVYANPILSLGVDLRTRKVFLGRCALDMEVDDWIRAAGVTRQAIWQERDGTPLRLDDAFAVAFDGESVLLEAQSPSSTGDESADEIERLTGYRLVAVGAPATEEERRRLETLQRQSDEESRPLKTAEPLALKAFQSKGRGEPATLGEHRLWTGRFLRSAVPAEGRLIARNDRTCAVLLEDGTLDLLLGLSEADAAYLNSVEGFASPRLPEGQKFVYRESDLEAIGRNLESRTVRAWTTWPLDGERAEAIAWDTERLFLRHVANGAITMLPLHEVAPEDRAWIDARPRPQFDVPPERWTPSADASKYPGCPAEPFDGAPIAFNGRAVLFVLSGGILPDLCYDIAALSPDSQRKILERFDGELDDRTRLQAAWRMRQGLWVEEPGKPFETFGYYPRIQFLPELDRAVAYDGEYLAVLLRRPPGVEGRLSRPEYVLVPLGPEGGAFHALEPQLRDRFVAGGRPLPDCDVPQLLAAYERVGRKEPPKLGERRLWEKGTAKNPQKPTWGRLVQTLGTTSVILDDQNRLDVTLGFTEADCKYLNSVEGFRPSDATDEEKTPAHIVEFGQPLNERYDQLFEGPVDGKFLRDLDDLVAYIRRSGRYDAKIMNFYVDVMNAFTSQLHNADVIVRDQETTRIKAAIASGEMSQVAGESKLKELEESPIDPADGSNQMEKSITQWKEELPDSSIPWTIEAGALYAVAWNARGDGTAGEVTEEGWRIHEQFAARANVAIEEAAKRTPGDYYLRDKHLKIGRSVGYDLEKMREVFYAGLDGNRNFYTLIDEMVFTLLPRWYGRPGDVGLFAAEMMDYYGDVEGTIVLNAIVAKQMSFEGSKLLHGEFPPEPLARAARYLADRADRDPGEHVRAEVFAFLGGNWRLAWELKRRTQHVRDPELKRWRDIDWSNDWSIRTFYGSLDGPPDVARVRRIDFESRDATPPTMTFVNPRICLIESGDGIRQAIDVAAMRPATDFTLPETLVELRLLPGADDRWLTAVALDPTGARRLVRFDTREEREPVVLKGADPFPAVIALSPFGDTVVGGGDQPAGELTFWDSATGEKLGSSMAPFAVRQALFAPGGEQIAVWDGERKVAFVDVTSREVGNTIELPAVGHFPQFARDGRLAFLIREGSATEPSWNVVAFEPNAAMPEELSSTWRGKFPAFGDVAFDEELKHAFVIAHPDAATPDERIYVLDVQTGETVATLDGHFAAPLQLEYRGEVERLYSVGKDRHLMEWDVSPEGLKATQNDGGL